MQNKKRWIIKNNNVKDSVDPAFPGIDNIIYRILLNRGIKDEESIKKFLYPELKDLYDPFLLHDMKDGVELIKRSVDLGKKIVIYGDYDADGITSTSILYICLKNIGANIECYIPNRMDEGYGLNFEAIDEIISNGAELIVTVDCGISSIKEVEYCKSKGVSIIITDHHECGPVIPSTIVINPKRWDSKYPFKGLAGVGVTFKLIQGLSRAFDGIDPYEYLDLTAIGTVADVVPILDENRIIVKYGIETIKKTKNYGLRALIDICGIDKERISTGQISFGIVPRVNAVGRISDASLGVKLFISEDVNNAKLIAQTLVDENKKRQEVEENILTEAENMVNSKYNPDRDYVIVLESENWHLGVIGIVASRIVEKYYRPVFLLSRDGEVYRGSGRSIYGFNLFEALSECKDLLVKYGGHEMAAGLSVDPEKLECFNERINKIAKEKLRKKYLIPALNVDFEIKGEDIDSHLVDSINMLEPFGVGNPSPLFLYKSMEALELRTVGVSDKHLKMKLKDGCEIFDAIGFNMGYNINGYTRESSIDVVCGIERNVWNGRENIQLLVKDMRKSPLKTVEEEYYKSLKTHINRLAAIGSIGLEDIEKLEMARMQCDEITDYADCNDLILVTNIYILEDLLRLSGNLKISFEKNQQHAGDGPEIIVCPDIYNINFRHVRNVYLMDSFIDYKEILRTNNREGITLNWVICESDPQMDVDFINKIKPSRKYLESVYTYIKRLSAGSSGETSLNKMSGFLSMNKLMIYYCLKILGEIDVISINPLKNGNMMLKVNNIRKADINDSCTLDKFDTIVNNLNILNKIFYRNKGE